MKAFYRSGTLAFFAVLSFLFSSGPIYSQEVQDTIVTDDVLVTAKKIASLTMESSKNITLISREDIERSPAENLMDLLSSYSGLDIKKRGARGVQADISIRGGSFEQILILVDGVRVSDPQTGHNNMNLPVNMEDIERIEILKGQASSIYGPNALSGAINIITKKGKRDELLLNLQGGQNGYYKGGMSLSYPLGDMANTVSLSREKSRGYRFNTAFDALTAALNSSLQFHSGSGKFSIGFTDKKFGANGFYSDRYPNQWEHLKTVLSSLSLNYALKNVSVTPKFYWRGNEDNYLLDYQRPEFYSNLHKTNSYGTQAEASWTEGFVRLLLGGELSFDNIKSSNLGNHTRQKGGFSLSAVLSPMEDLKIAAGGFLYNYDSFGWKYWPGVDVSYQFREDLSLKASIGKSFRIPTFTELYYNSPAQKGNALLQPEEALSYEAGLYYNDPVVSGSLSVFSRKGKSLIDWIRYSSDLPWQAENVTRVNTTGIDASFSITPRSLPVKKITLGYSHLSSDLKTGLYQSRYILDHLKNQFTASLMHDVPFGMEMSWTFRYENRLDMKEYFITDSKLSYQLQSCELFLEASNVFNKYYMDFSGIPMPGRWIIGGVKYKLGLE
ncbi:MAG TPA: TonB-dependent receptor [Ignavibacteriales bacterium]|nr:TonB-dependent receptor [Ignavibacteriales bacterium]